MKINDIKKRVSYAIRALKGEPIIEPIAVPVVKVERYPVKTLKVKYEISLDELGRREPGFETYCIMHEIRAKLLKQMEASGFVQHRAHRFGDRVVYTAEIRVVEPCGED